MTDCQGTEWPVLLLVSSHHCGAGAHVCQNRGAGGGHDKLNIFTQVSWQTPGCFQRKIVFLGPRLSGDGVAAPSTHVPVPSDLAKKYIIPPSLTRLSKHVARPLSSSTGFLPLHSVNTDSFYFKRFGNRGFLPFGFLPQNLCCLHIKAYTWMFLAALIIIIN